MFTKGTKSMIATRWTVEGRVFQNQTDYNAALRDLDKINKIRKQVNFNNYNELNKLFDLVQSGEHQFESILGRDFDDEIFELIELLKTNTFLKKEKEKKKGSREKNKKNNKVTIKLEDYDEEFRKEIMKQIKLREKRRKLMISFFSILAICCIGYFVFYSYMSDKNQKDFDKLASLKEMTSQSEVAVKEKNEKSKGIISKQNQEEIVIPEILEKYKTLYNKNKRLIGWLKIDDTIIDYPVLQSSSSEYYLDHNFNQEYDKNGSIFLDPQCNILDRSDNLIVYGHHMQSGKMFGSLEKYKDEDFYKKHPLISFDTIYEEGSYQIIYVFRSRIYNEEDVVFKYYQFINASSETEFNSNMEEMSKMSLYNTEVTARYGDELLTLSTCDYQETNGRFIVVAKKIP